MVEQASGAARPGLRERKKQLTRQAILDASERLFARDGYDRVTVAHIADAANISVKTLFTYFDSKEDLAFGDEDVVRDALCAAVRDRPAGCSALESVRVFLLDLAERDEGRSGGIEGFHRAFDSIPQLHSRLLLMFERYEEALTRVLEEDAAAPAEGPGARVAAAQLVSLLRLTTSEEGRRAVAARPASARPAALAAWINDSASHLAAGLSGYAVRGTSPEGAPAGDRSR